VTQQGRRIVFVNSAAGSGDASAIVDGLVERGFVIDDRDDDLEARVRAAVDAGAEAVAVVGGDGSQRSAARMLSGSDTVLIAAPGGTFNHFAKAVGTGADDAVLHAVDRGDAIDVPVAHVNGEPFLNTAVMGWYPDLVRTRERLRQRMPRPVAALAAGLWHVARAPRITVTVPGLAARPAWMVWVGNGRYGTTLDDLARDDVTDETLDVRIAWTSRRLAKARLAYDLVRKRWSHGPHADRLLVREPLRMVVDVRRVTMALDAEVVTVSSPLTFVPAAEWVRVMGHRVIED
jgi:diacylglycerol kinase family enzyme